MATSGTTAFDLKIDDIIEEAYERCGIRTNSGYDLRSARRSLNLLFSEWGNRGVHLWKVSLNEVSLSGDVLENYISSTGAINAQNTALTDSATTVILNDASTHPVFGLEFILILKTATNNN